MTFSAALLCASPRAAVGPISANTVCTARNGASLWALAARFRWRAPGRPPRPSWATWRRAGIPRQSARTRRPPNGQSVRVIASRIASPSPFRPGSLGVRTGSADPQRTPPDDVPRRPVTPQVRRSHEICKDTSNLWGSAAAPVGYCQLVAEARNLLWIRRSAVRIHPAVPDKSITYWLLADSVVP
jgi:hypothetical protein